MYNRDFHAAKIIK